MNVEAPRTTNAAVRNFLRGMASVFDAFPAPSEVYQRLLRSTPERFAQTNRRIGNSLNRAFEEVSHVRHDGKRPDRRGDARTSTLVSLGYLSERDWR